MNKFMFKRKLNFLAVALFSIILTFGITVSLGYLFAVWVSPASPPPDGNVSKPINVGTSAQTIGGSLGVMGNLSVGNSSLMLLGQASSPVVCDSVSKGGMYFDTDINKPCYCYFNGSTWNWVRFDTGANCN